MGGAVIEKDSTIAPLSLVLKEMNVSSGYVEGSPAEVVKSSSEFAINPPQNLEQSNTATNSISQILDNTDWLKTVAIILVLVDHIGYFFIEDDHWWSVFGRMAAPSFFFLIGYANTRKVPLQWIILGVILTVLDSSNNNWTWVAPNILLSFTLIRAARPYAARFVEKYGIAAYAVMAVLLVALLPAAKNAFDYGTEGWLWALLGLSQRMRADNQAAEAEKRFDLKGFLISAAICVVTALVYVRQEQNEFHFSPVQFKTFAICLAVLSLAFCLFARGKSRIQLPNFAAGAMRFIGRHTLEIYALELVVFELVIKIMPEWGP